jgi:uncharacterized membrane protein YgaE (UPF0421/DUF939 family)
LVSNSRVEQGAGEALPCPSPRRALAAGLSWLIAGHVVGHRAPFFAPVAAVVCLGMTLSHRLRRAIELIVGVGVGIGIGDVLISAIGTGPWQIALVVALAMSVAVLLDGGAVITGQAAVSAILVATRYLPGDTRGVSRLVDGLIGGATGLLVVGVFPRSSCPGSAVVVTEARGLLKQDSSSWLVQAWRGRDEVEGDGRT